MGQFCIEIKTTIPMRILFLFLVVLSFAAQATESHQKLHHIKGKIYDETTREPLTGATVLLTGTNHYAIAGLDGSFFINNVPPANYQLEISYISYEPVEKSLDLNASKQLDIAMKPAVLGLEAVVVTTSRIGHTEASARASERNAPNVINVISQRAIELSPDITVANVAQRVSGVALERNATGDGQHAIMRGMEKRYNYTLVNGVKIPSPDNNNRYVPLDIFPAELLERWRLPIAHA